MLPCICCLCKQVVLWSNIYCVSVVLTGCFCSLAIADESGECKFYDSNPSFSVELLFTNIRRWCTGWIMSLHSKLHREIKNIFVSPHVGNFIKWRKKPSNCVKNVGAFRSFPSNVMISNALSTALSSIGRHILAADDDDRCHLAEDGLTWWATHRSQDEIGQKKE